MLPGIIPLVLGTWEYTSTAHFRIFCYSPANGHARQYTPTTQAGLTHQVRVHVIAPSELYFPSLMLHRCTAVVLDHDPFALLFRLVLVRSSLPIGSSLCRL